MNTCLIILNMNIVHPLKIFNSANRRKECIWEQKQNINLE